MVVNEDSLDGKGRAISIRPPRPTDAASIWRLLWRIPELERNTSYAYVLLCSDYARSCVVAEERAGQLAGFVMGYIPKERPDELVIWQIGVAPELRRRGLGGQMLDYLVTSCKTARFLIAAVSADNLASRRMFRVLARRHAVPCEIRPGHSSSLFGDLHESQEWTIIGPFPMR